MSLNKSVFAAAWLSTLTVVPLCIMARDLVSSALVIDVVDIDDIGESDEIGQCDRGNCTVC